MAAFWFLTVFSANAMAQQGALEVYNEPNYVAAAVAAVPDYVGSDDYTGAVAPAGRFTFSGKRDIKIVAANVSANVLDHEFWRLGPVINYRFARDSVDDNSVDLMKDIDGTFEIGATVGLDFTNDVNRRYRFGGAVEFLYDAGGEHDGYLITTSVQYWKPLSLAWDFGIRGGFTYGDGNYMDTYFGVDAADSARSGLAQFSASSGIRDVSVTPVLMFHLSKKWHIGGFLRYQRILSDAADSPIVDQRGDPNQLLFGLGVAYSW